MRRIIGALSAVAGAAGITFLSALPAQATNYVVVYWNSMPPSNTGYACNGGATHVLSTGIGVIVTVTNNCSVRVWLHQYANGGGTGQCISPHTSAHPTHAVNDQLQITNNTAKC